MPEKVYQLALDDQPVDPGFYGDVVSLVVEENTNTASTARLHLGIQLLEDGSWTHLDGAGAGQLELFTRLSVRIGFAASGCEDCPVKIPELRDSDVKKLEESIDRMELTLVPLDSFILPGGHPISSQCHIARTVCRRAEREIIRLSAELFVPDTVIKYMNRLSDYLFVLSRKVLRDFELNDIPWKPEL